MRPELQVEIVSDDEMAIIEAALAAAAARPLLSAAATRGAAALSCAAFSTAGDIEDSPPPLRRSLLSRFRERRALAVTDITATEWCDKQMEFVLEHGKPERTQAMKAGSERHAQLEQEVIERVDIAIRSAEELWAVKFMNFIVGTNQLLFKGLTRELPVWMCGHTRKDRVRNDDIRDRVGVAPIAEKLVQHRLRWFGHIQRRPPEAPVHTGRLKRAENVKRGWVEPRESLLSMCQIHKVGVVEGSWMVGVIDEIRMPVDGISFHPVLVDTKTRFKATIPSEAQKRNGRLQLMCYKYLWDTSIAEKFPAENFFSYFNLNPDFLLSDDVKRFISSLGFNAQTFGDVMKYYKITCHTLSRSQEQLILRYELQADHSLLEEYKFSYDDQWFKDQIHEALNFWLGAREPKFVTEEELWKCRFCKFASNCPKMASNLRC